MRFLRALLIAFAALAAASALAAGPSDVKSRMDALYSRLVAAKDAQEAKAIALQIDELRLVQPSATADLLMHRAIVAMDVKDYALSLDLLDHVVALWPDWTEAWNKRATVRWLEGDDKGSLADVERTLKRDPRHFGALDGKGFVLMREKDDSGALAAFRASLKVYPLQEGIRKLVETLKVKVEGRDI